MFLDISSLLLIVNFLRLRSGKFYPSTSEFRMFIPPLSFIEHL